MTRWQKNLLALAIGTAGGALAYWVKSPLPWMIGAMLAVTAAAIGKLPVALPIKLRNAMVAVIGVMLGSGFRPEMIDKLGDWSISLIALLAYTVIAGALGFIYFRAVEGYDRPTSYFSAMPGGLSEMTLVGAQLGGDERVIAMTHAARVLLVVLTLPFCFALFLDYHPGQRPPVGPDLDQIAPLDWAILGACAVLGYFGGKRLKLPASQIVGPMLLSAGVHLAGLTKAAPPALLVAAAQVVIGTALGSRFAGTPLSFLWKPVKGAMILTVILLSTTLGVAFLMHEATGLSTPLLVLSYAPGGLAEMSLVAIAMSFEATFVAFHHIVRIFLVVVLAPFVFRRARRGNAA